MIKIKSNKIHLNRLSIFLISLLVFITGSYSANAATVPSGKYLAITVCPDCVVIVNGPTIKTGSTLRLYDFVDYQNNWDEGFGINSTVKVTGMEDSGTIGDSPDIMDFFFEFLQTYGYTESTTYKVYKVDEDISYFFTAALFSIKSVEDNSNSAAQILAAQQQKQMEEAKSLAVAALGIAAVSNSLSKLTASLLPKTVCVKKGKPNKKVSALKSCPKGYKVKK